MIILDTDHFSELLDRRSLRGSLLQSRLEQAVEPLAISIVTVEELLRGWLAFIHRRPDPRSQVIGYARLNEFLHSVQNWTVLPWTVDHADHFRQLRAAKVRTGSMDLKIAVTAILENAKLLTANARDFNAIPGILLENWLY